MRELIAFGLLTLLIVGASILAVWLNYNSQERRYRRQRKRDRERYALVMAQNAGVRDNQA